jgi:hypothetical protein
LRFRFFLALSSGALGTTLWLIAATCLASFARAETWQEALSKMPLASPVRELNRTNCVNLLLNSLGSNQTVRGLVFMPGSTDEIYFFKRVKAALTNSSPTLLDAIAALTNQTWIRVAWRPPLLLLHTQEDDTEPVSKVTHERTAAELRTRRFLPHALFYDYDWDHLMPVLKKQLKVSFRPWKGRLEGNHFFRHCFVGWNLTGWETLEAAALAGKTMFTVKRGRVDFEGDERFHGLPPGEIPPLESYGRWPSGARTNTSAKP